MIEQLLARPFNGWRAAAMDHWTAVPVDQRKAWELIMSKVFANKGPKKTAPDGAEPHTSPQTDMATLWLNWPSGANSVKNCGKVVKEWYNICEIVKEGWKRDWRIVNGSWKSEKLVVNNLWKVVKVIKSIGGTHYFFWKSREGVMKEWWNIVVSVGMSY